MQPFIIQLGVGVYGIGIDLNLSVIDFRKREVVVNTEFFSYFYEVLVKNDFFYVITQLEIEKYRLKDYQKIREYGLPDIFEGMTFKDNVLHVKCMDGKTYEFCDA